MGPGERTNKRGKFLSSSGGMALLAEWAGQLLGEGARTENVQVLRVLKQLPIKGVFPIAVVEKLSRVSFGNAAELLENPGTIGCNLLNFTVFRGIDEHQFD